MIIDEKGLCRAMKSAWKRGGYNVMDDGQRIRIWSDFWFLQADREKVPVKALALMVEHMGALPGAPTHLKKDEDPQMVLEDVAEAEIRAWIEGEMAEEVSWVPMTFCGAQMLQEEFGGACYGVMFGCIEMVERTYCRERSARAVGTNRILWNEEGEMVIMTAMRPSRDLVAQKWQSTAWTALESVDLHRKEA